MNHLNKHLGHSWDEFVSENMNNEQISEMSKDTEIIASFIRLRDSLRLSQKDMAELSDIKQPMIARIESGKINVGIKTFQKLLKPLGYTLAIMKIKEKNILSGMLSERRKALRVTISITLFYCSISKMS